MIGINQKNGEEGHWDLSEILMPMTLTAPMTGKHS